MKHASQVLTTFLGLFAPVPAAQAVTDKPKIILLFADDISARELPIYGSTVWGPPTGGDTGGTANRA